MLDIYPDCEIKYRILLAALNNSTTCLCSVTHRRITEAETDEWRGHTSRWDTVAIWQVQHRETVKILVASLSNQYNI